MKVFFDTNVYIAESLLGGGAEAVLRATQDARWRIYVNDHVLIEVERVMTEQLECSPRFAKLTRDRCRRRAIHIAPVESKHAVPNDPADTPILQAAVSAGLDFLVTNDQHLLALHPHESLKIISMAAYHQLLEVSGLIKPQR